MCFPARKRRVVCLSHRTQIRIEIECSAIVLHEYIYYANTIV